jgi:multidrug efflux system membrane fusion protein
VRTVLVQQQTTPIIRAGVGTVKPIMSVTVRTRVDGQLDTVSFREGQDVRMGQTIAQIDPRPFKAQLSQNLAQKAKDTATLANARMDQARYEQLIKEDATTRQTLDTQRAVVEQLKAALLSDDAQIELARVNLGYTTIQAPISGRAGARLVDPGNIVRASDPNGLLVINQIDPIAVQFTLPESSFQDINAALTANAAALPVQAIDRNNNQVLASGKLALVNNQIDSSTGTILLKAEFPNPQRKLWPGQSVDARITLGQREQALTVPAPVVQRGQDGLYAYVIDEQGVAHTRPIEVDQGSSQGSTAVITNGLSVGERVVVDGQYRLTVGARVTELQAGSNAPGQGRAMGGASSASTSASVHASASVSANNTNVNPNTDKNGGNNKNTDNTNNKGSGKGGMAP